MLGELDNIGLDDIPNSVSMPLDEAISELKRYKSELPMHTLFFLSSRHVAYLKRILAIIEGLDVPERLTND